MRTPCEKFERRLQRLADQRRSLSRDVRLARHSRKCKGCRQSLLAHELLAAEVSRCADLAAAVEPELKRRLAARVIAHFRQPAPAAQRPEAQGPLAKRSGERISAARISAEKWQVGAALAAAMMLVVWSAAHRAPRAQKNGPPPATSTGHLQTASVGHRQAASVERPRLAAGRAASRSRVGSAHSNTRRQVQLLATETGGQLAAAARWLPGLSSASQASLGSPGGPGSPGASESNSLKSWTDSMSDALNRWFDALPPQQPTSRS